MESFDYKIQKIEGKDLHEISLSGRLIDDETAREMVDELNDILEKGHTNFIVNLEKLDYINSSGLNQLVNLLTKTRSKGGDVVLSNLSEKVQSLFIVTKLNTVFTVVDSQEDAISSF